MNSDVGLPHCRAFWTVAGVVGTLGLTGLVTYVARQFAKGSTSETGDEAGRTG